MATNGKRYSRAELEQLIKELMGVQSIPPNFNKQINKFVLENDMTLKEIARCIDWYVEVRQGKIDPLYGLWFVPNVREQAEQYFKQLELDQQRQAEQARKVIEIQDNNIIFNVNNVPRRKREPKKLDISEINVKGEDEDDGQNH